MTPAHPSEAQIQRDILRSFEDPALWGDVSIKRTHPVNATEHSLRGGVYSTRRIQAGERGQSDLTAYLRVGLGDGVTLCSAVLGMEIKTSTGRVEQHQWEWLAAAERQGWYVAVVRSVEDAHALVRAARRALRAGLRGDLETVRQIRAGLRAPLEHALGAPR